MLRVRVQQKFKVNTLKDSIEGLEVIQCGFSNSPFHPIEFHKALGLFSDRRFFHLWELLFAEFRFLCLDLSFALDPANKRELLNDCRATDKF
jgi:hypothetical protein